MPQQQRQEDPDWNRRVQLGQHLRNRRIGLGYRTRHAMHEATRLSTSSQQAAENGTRGEFSPGLRAMIETAYQLPVGSIGRFLNYETNTLGVSLHEQIAAQLEEIAARLRAAG